MHQDNLNFLDTIFTANQDMRRTTRHAIISMYLVVTCCYTITVRLMHKPKLDARVVRKSKKLLFYTHQTFLKLCEVVLSRLPASSQSSIYQHSLQYIILNKGVQVTRSDPKQLSLKGQNSQEIREFSEKDVLAQM